MNTAARRTRTGRCARSTCGLCCTFAIATLTTSITSCCCFLHRYVHNRLNTLVFRDAFVCCYVVVVFFFFLLFFFLFVFFVLFSIVVYLCMCAREFSFLVWYFYWWCVSHLQEIEEIAPMLGDRVRRYRPALACVQVSVHFVCICLLECLRACVCLFECLRACVCLCGATDPLACVQVSVRLCVLVCICVWLQTNA